MKDRREDKINDQIDHLFRQSHGKLISLLLARFGTSQVEVVENALMESYLRALRVWPYKGQPEQPQAWLYRTACNIMIDQFRKNKRIEYSLEDLDIESERYDFNDGEILDPELKLLFLICHPSLKPEDQLAFMLKTLSGLGDHEISHALMVKKATIKKRLSRARSYLSQSRPAFNWPEDAEVKRRIKLVHQALYLLFNEGFYSSHPEYLYRKDLCVEAMRLCKYLADHAYGDEETFALLSLMCYHISRFKARVSAHGELVLLPDQDRSKWDPYFMKLGGYYLEKSVTDAPRSRYQIEAFISATHCMSKSLSKTNWSMLRELYKALHNMTKERHVLLNLVVVHIYMNDLSGAEELYIDLNADDFTHKTLYYLVGIKLYESLKDSLQVEMLLEKAVRETNSAREVSQLSRTKSISKN